MGTTGDANGELTWAEKTGDFSLRPSQESAGEDTPKGLVTDKGADVASRALLQRAGAPQSEEK